MNTHQLLVKARNDIARFGWKGGGGFEPGQARCAGNALYGACRSTEYGAAAAAMCQAIGLPESEHPAGDLYDWNDAPGRTKDEVLAAFDQAIAATAPLPADPFKDQPLDRASFREPLAEWVETWEESVQ